MARLDIIVFGATGYTGSYLVKELATTFQNEKITWGIAGRSQKRLNALLKAAQIEERSIPTFIVDIENAESIKIMCENAQVVINCVGPYRFYGEQVIKACLAAGTHHLDVSGEPEYLENMQLKYDQEALEKNVYIVGSCGFDSVPADMGVVFTQNSFKNELSYIESYLLVDSDGPLHINFATWESAVYGFGYAKNLLKIRKELFKTRLPKPEVKVPKRTNFLGYFYDNLLKKYCFNFMGSDKSVVQRTQYFNNKLNKKTIQYAPYFTINSFRSTLLMILFGLNFALLANSKIGRNLLLKYHRLFSCGLVKKLEEDPDKNMDKTTFKFQFRGVGFCNEESKASKKPDQSIITEMTGPEPGYISTSRIIINCAITILEEQDSIPVKGGVLTPAGAFANTKLLDRLSISGIKCTVLYNGPNQKQNEI